MICVNRFSATVGAVKPARTQVSTTNQNIFDERFIFYRLNFKASSSWRTVLDVLLRVGETVDLTQHLFKISNRTETKKIH